MLGSGLPVPDGFCISTAAFGRFLQGVDQLESFYASLEDLASEPLEPVQAAAARLRERLADVPIPAEVAGQILSAWQSLGADLAYAVRSSATAEDLPHASCAGQHDTFLHVRGRDALLTAVRRCWISLFTDRAVLYRMRNHISQRSAAMAVTVQQMVSADAAGVVFTADPLTGDRGRIVMEGTWGLGEALVSGQVGPDRIVLDKRTLHVVESSVGRKTIEIVPDMAGGVRQREVVADRQDQPCLDETLARRPGKLARKAERLFGGPQDLEWATSGGRVFLLQSRPITVLPTETQQEQDVWSDVGTGEVLPDVVTPMSWSILSSALQGLFDPILRHVGIDLQTNRWLGLVAGRVYMNVTTTAEVLRILPGPSPLELNETFGGRQASRAVAKPARAPRGKRSWNWLRLPACQRFSYGWRSMRRTVAALHSWRSGDNVRTN